MGAQSLRSNIKVFLTYLLMVIAVSFLAAHKTTQYDSSGMVLLNTFGVVLIVSVAHIIFLFPPLVLIGIGYIFGKKIDHLPQWLINASMIIGIFVLFYSFPFMGNFYQTYQSWSVEVIYGH